MPERHEACVQSTLNYLGKVQGKPTNYLFDPPEGVPRRYPMESHSVAIYDGRPGAEHLSLEKEGLIFRSHAVADISNFHDETEIESVYYPAVVDLVKKETGASRAIIFDHTYRSSLTPEEGGNEANMPVDDVHNDYTDNTGPLRAREAGGSSAAQAIAANRFMIVNVWRPINGPIEQKPLAVCDVSTMVVEDFVPADIKFPTGRTGEVLSVKHRPTHRWLYFSNMDTDEALVFRTFDPRRSGADRYGAHAAFDDPNSPDKPRVRESLEVRVLALFDD